MTAFEFADLTYVILVIQIIGHEIPPWNWFDEAGLLSEGLADRLSIKESRDTTSVVSGHCRTKSNVCNLTFPLYIHTIKDYTSLNKQFEYQLIFMLILIKGNN